MIDIVFPNNNEKEFIEVASKISLNKLCFVYGFGKIPKEKFKESVAIGAQQGIKIILGELCSEKEIHKSKADVKFVKNPTRTCIENGKVDAIFDLEDTPKDFIHQRGSGMNHILAKILFEKEIIYCFDVSLLRANPKVLARMKQNFRLCIKYDVEYRICSFARKPFSMISKDSILALEVELKKR